MDEIEQKRAREVTNARHEIDARVTALEALPRSREIALAITKLQEARMWLGMALYS